MTLRIPRHRHLVQWLALACCFTVCALADSTAAAADERDRSHAVWRARSQIIVDGVPTALFWATGPLRLDEVEAYSEIGFSAIEIVVSSPADADWEQAEALAHAAVERGMLVLVTIAPPAKVFSGIAISPWEPSYKAAVHDYVEPIVERGVQLLGLVGWVVEAVECETLRFSESDFRHYLMRWHGSVQGISANWGTPIGDSTALTESFVAGLDSGKPLGLGRASLDLARYRSEVYRDLLDIWAQEIRSCDRRHVILAGRQHSYRAAISVSTSCDGMLLGLYPGVAENDLETHNVHGVDVARRGNQMAALPVLKIAAAKSGAQLAGWIAQAILHGAAGIGFADWKDLRDRDEIQHHLRTALRVTREAKLCPRVPAPSTAVLYQPFAAGGIAAGRPLYGWLTGASVSEPGRLFRALARGTAFGQFDYLSRLSGVALDRYRVIIAPLAFSLTAADQTALAAFVAQGGTLIADLGVGFAQSGDLARLSPDLEQLFGVMPAPSQASPSPAAGPGSSALLAAAIAMLPHPRFPSLQQEMAAEGTRPAFFDPPVCSVTLSGGAVPLLAQSVNPPAFAGIMARPCGKGWALYGTTRLWQNWLPGARAFDAFHRDLFGFDSPIALKQPGELFAPDEIGAFRDGSVMVLKRSQAPTEVLLRNSTGHVYHIRGGMQEIRCASVSANSLLIFGRPGLQVADPVPIEIATDARRLIVQMVSYSDDLVSFALYGPTTRLVATPGRDLAVTASGEATAHVRIARGTYRVRRGSRHEVEIRDLRGTQISVQVAAVGTDEVLAFDAPANTWATIRRVARQEWEPTEKGASAPGS